MRDAIDNAGEDGSAKIFDVNSFDMIGMITLHTSKDDGDDGTVKTPGRQPTYRVAVRFAEKRASRVQQLFAVGDSTGRITIYDANINDLNRRK